MLKRIVYILVLLNIVAILMRLEELESLVLEMSGQRVTITSGGSYKRDPAQTKNVNKRRN